MKKKFLFLMALLAVSLFVMAEMGINVYKKDGSSVLYLASSINRISFDDVTIENLDYVDLGLSVKWATCNVGAKSPEEFGELYGWGQIEPYPVCDFNEEPSVLPLSQDVANIKRGNDWRMPTVEEFEELFDNTTYVYTTYNGVNGLKFTSKINGGTIFLPAAGNQGSADVVCEPSIHGNYWTSTYNSRDGYNGWNFWFSSTRVTWPNEVRDTNRCAGLSVRPVFTK